MKQTQKTKGKKGTKLRKQKSENPQAQPLSAFSQLIAALVAPPALRDKYLAQNAGLATAAVLRGLAAAIAGAEASNDGIVNTLAFFVKDQVLAELRSHGFLTNDLVDIHGGNHSGFDRFDNKLLLINGITVAVDRRQYIVIALLAHHARKHWVLRSLIHSELAPFMPIDEIRKTIDALKAKHRELGDVLNNVVDQDIHRIISELRHKLESAGLNKLLIESRLNGAGYRLSTRPGNITPDPGFTAAMAALSDPSLAA